MSFSGNTQVQALERSPGDGDFRENQLSFSFPSYLSRRARRAQ